jgi:C1A family cysteine protease
MFLDKDWPYKAVNGNCAQETPTTVQPSAFKTTGVQAISQQSVDALKGALEMGPVSVAIQADEKTFQSYKSGVFDAECGTQLDHAVLLVGYGVEDDKEFWIMKNSWGTTWGDAGYMKMVQNGDGAGQCGVMMDPVQPE